jgi:lysine-N-methylase
MTGNIYIERGARYQCVPDCGFCCGFWDIHVDLKRKDELLEKTWVQIIAEDLEKRNTQELFRIIGQREQAIVQRQAGTCSFIDERQLCSIHAKEGYASKPLACQQYPFIYYQTPRGLEVFLDHSCPEVILNKGELVTEEEVRDRISNENTIEVALPIPLTSSVSLDWESYLALEEVLLEITRQESSYEERILCLHQLITEVGKQHRPDDKIGATKTAIQCVASDGFAAALAKARLRPSNPSRRDLYLAILIQLVESAYSREVGPGRMSMVDLLKKIVKQWKNTGKNQFYVFKFQVNYQDIPQIDFNCREQPHKEILNRYFSHLVKRFVGTGKIPINKRVAILATNYALVKWFSRAFAASQRRSKVSQEDLVFGIKVVEKFLSNGLFNKMSKEKNFLSNYINFLYDNPSLPGTMLSS